MDPIFIKYDELYEYINNKIEENTEIINKKIDNQKDEILNLNNNIKSYLNEIKTSIHINLTKEMKSIVKRYISDILSEIDSSQLNLSNYFKEENEKLLNETRMSINEKNNRKDYIITLIPIYTLQITILALLLISLFK